MTYKICQVIFSTNRLEYLTRTLTAQRHLDFGDCQVDKIFIDDFPKDRNNVLISELVKCFGYNEIYLHEVNQGLSVTWTEFWKLIRDRGYDYVWHQEDDVEILETVHVKDLIRLLELDKDLSQVVLKRQAWYFTESESAALPTDWTFGHYRYEKGGLLFSPMASIYSTDHTRFNYSQWYGENYPEENWSTINLNEGMIGKALYEAKRLVTAVIKNSEGKNYINHIGEYFVGKRLLPGEPHYEQFERFDPEKKYYSRDGAEYTIG
jgi:hypothetical protein